MVEARFPTNFKGMSSFYNLGREFGFKPNYASHRKVLLDDIKYLKKLKQNEHDMGQYILHNDIYTGIHNNIWRIEGFSFRGVSKIYIFLFIIILVFIIVVRNSR